MDSKTLTVKNLNAAELERFTSVVPNGYVHAVILEHERLNADANATHGYGACPVCGHTDHENRNGAYRSTNENDKEHERVYCKQCLIVERFSRAYIRRVMDCKPQKCNRRLSFVCEVNPASVSVDNNELAAAMLTPSRNVTTDTIGRWYRKNDGGYSSPIMRANLKQLNKRMDSVFDTCAAGTITLDILIDGLHVETLEFEFNSERMRKDGRFVSKKDALMIKIDWEVGKYREEGRGLYHRPENRERAKVERAGMDWRGLFK